MSRQANDGKEAPRRDVPVGRGPHSAGPALCPGPGHSCGSHSDSTGIGFSQRKKALTHRHLAFVTGSADGRSNSPFPAFAAPGLPLSTAHKSFGFSSSPISPPPAHLSPAVCLGASRHIHTRRVHRFVLETSVPSTSNLAGSYLRTCPESGTGWTGVYAYVRKFTDSR